MALTYEWEIKSVKTKTEGSNEDSVVYVEFSKYAYNEDGVRAEFIGSIELTSADTETFTPFSDLVEADIINWIKAEVEEEHINDSLDSTMAGLTDTSIEKALPWV